MSKETTKNRIQTEITSATTNNSITPTIVGTILDEIIELPIVDPRPYKVYTALVSQSGENPPTAIVLENTLGGEIVWTRDFRGQYTGTLANAFVDANKVAILPALSRLNFVNTEANATIVRNMFLMGYQGSADTIVLNTYNVITFEPQLRNSNYWASDDYFYGQCLEIRVYN